MELEVFNIFLKLKNLKLIFSEVENPKLRHSYNNSFAKFLGKCKIVISPSKLIKNEISVIAPELNKDIEVIPWAISKPDEYKQLAKASSDTFIIGALGRFDYIKGFHILIKALYEINKEFQNWKLVLAGDGDEKENLINLVKELNLEDKVHFMGWVSDVSNFFNQIDIFVNPSFTEGMPMVIIESLYYSKPIIATDVGSVSEMFDQNCGFIIQPNKIDEISEKLIFFIKNREELKNKGNFSRKIFEEKFSSKVILESLEKVYDKVLEINN